MNVFGTFEFEGVEVKAVSQVGLAGGCDVAIMIGDEIVTSATVSKMMRAKSIRVKPGAAKAMSIPMLEVGVDLAAPGTSDKAVVAKQPAPTPEPEDDDSGISEDDLI